MVIGVNTRFLLDGQMEGIGWFTFETVKRIVLAHPEHEFVFFFDRPFSEKFLFADNVKGVVVGPPARHPILWYIWFEMTLPKQLKKHGVDLFLSPDGFNSLSNKVPSVSVIHDIAFEHNSFGVYRTAMWFYKYFTPRYAKKSTRVATVSSFSKEDIQKQYGINGEKIDVVYDGANESFEPIADEEKIAIRKQFSDGKPYFIYVGAIHPRKNVLRLLKAFHFYKQKMNNDMQLLIVGRMAWSNNDLVDYLKEMPNHADVRFLGSQDQETLNGLIGAAQAMTYVSIFEGFGIPVLEAMYCHVPSIVSNVTSLPEVIGNAGIMCDPENEKEIGEAMIQMTDPTIHEGYAHHCISEKLRFNWDKTAELLWDSMMKATSQK